MAIVVNVVCSSSLLDEDSGSLLELLEAGAELDELKPVSELLLKATSMELLDEDKGAAELETSMLLEEDTASLELDFASLELETGTSLDEQLDSALELLLSAALLLDPGVTLLEERSMCLFVRSIGWFSPCVHTRPVMPFSTSFPNESFCT